MKLRLIARRYAEAFIDYVENTIGLESAIHDIKNLRQIIRDNPEFKQILLSPGLSDTEKSEFIYTILKEYFSIELIQFLELLIEKRRIPQLDDIIDYIISNYCPGEIVESILKTAYPLDPETIQTIEEKMKDRFKKNLHFSLKLDKTLLGGVEVEVGNTVIDGSVRRRLEELRDELKTVRMD